MHHAMFDVDGTLVESFQFDEDCYSYAVFKVLGQRIDTDWAKYEHVSDAGILDEHLKKSGLLNMRDEIHSKVKSAFISKIRKHLSLHAAKQVKGAADFISTLRSMDKVSLSIATGGWGETALMKLDSAGIDVAGIPVSSSNDHFSRIEIMRTALRKADVTPKHKLTYFGDAAWDKKACEALKFNFVLVGNRVEHHQSISNFSAADKACRFIGL